MTIQWYPGHMAKAKRQIIENLRLVDVVIELADARIPQSSRNPDITEIHQKPYIVAVTKEDLADNKRTRLWMDFWRTKNENFVLLNLLEGKGISKLVSLIKKSLSEIRRTPRVLVVGIPNVGKSSLINRLANKGSTKVGAKPGVTRGKQWINTRGLQLLDTPGILWPKFNNQEIARKLAVVSSINDDVLDWEELANWLLNFMIDQYWQNLSDRYKLSEPVNNMLEYIGKKRGCLLPGGVIDTRQAASVVLHDFRTGKLGEVTLEIPEYGVKI